MFIIQTNRRRALLKRFRPDPILERWQGSVSGKRMAGMSALRTDPGIDCPAQLADLLNYDQHHPLAPVRSRVMEALWLPGNDG
jgi:hypothetical protein